MTSFSTVGKVFRSEGFAFSGSSVPLHIFCVNKSERGKREVGEGRTVYSCCKASYKTNKLACGHLNVTETLNVNIAACSDCRGPSTKGAAMSVA